MSEKIPATTELVGTTELAGLGCPRKYPLPLNSIVVFYFIIKHLQDIEKIGTTTKLVFSEGFFLRESGINQVHIVIRTHNLDLGTPLYAQSNRKNQKLHALHATPDARR